MKKVWVAKKKKEMLNKKNEILNEIGSFLEKEGMNSEHVQYIKDFIKSEEEKYGDVYTLSVILKIDEMDEMQCDVQSLRRELEKSISEYNMYNQPMDRLLDSEPMLFDGDIVITDPCYVSKDEDWTRFYDDPFMPNCMMRDTLYGDWSCTTFDLNGGKPFGQFCADAGLVGVFLFDEIEKYNPIFKTECGDRCWTLIKNFKGACQFVVKKTRYKYEGEWNDDYSVEVHGHGVNKETGEPIDFVGKQTGL